MIRFRAPLLLAALFASTTLAASYTDSKYGFQLSYPAGWTVQPDVMGAAVAVLAPPVNNFSRNVNVVVIGGVPAGTTLDSVYSQNVATLRKLMTDFKVLAERRLTVDGQPARELVYTGRQGQYSLRQKQRYVLHGGKLYVLTATGLKGDAAADRLLDPVLDSFKLGR